MASVKVKKILEGCLDLIPSPSPSVKIQIVKHDKTTFADLSSSTVVVREKEGTVVAKTKDGCHVVDVVNSQRIIPSQDLNFHGR